MEITAYSGYSERFYPAACRRTASGLEVDFITGDGETEVEVKSSVSVQNQQTLMAEAHRMKNK